MIFHSFTAYLKYRWKAKGRHGTHSPFVYNLVEQVLQNKEVLDKQYIVSYPSIALRYENLLSRIAAYYKYKDIIRLPPDIAIVTPHVDMLLLDGRIPMQWVELLEECYPLLKNDSAVVAIDIHKSPAHTKGWVQLCADPKVRMSIDLYGVGVLLFREEFKEQQHFILKY